MCGRVEITVHNLLAFFCPMVLHNLVYKSAQLPVHVIFTKSPRPWSDFMESSRNGIRVTHKMMMMMMMIGYESRLLYMSCVDSLLVPRSAQSISR